MQISNSNHKKKPRLTNYSMLKKAFSNSQCGLKYMLQERAFLQELLLLPIIVAYIVIVKPKISYSFYIFSSYTLILIFECVNTCVETIIDRISDKEHGLSKKAKDIGSFLVIISIIHLVCVLIFVAIFDQ